MKRSECSFEAPTSELIKSLEASLGIKSTINTNINIDIAVKRAKEGDTEALNWLVLNFLPLVIKITFSPVLRVKNAYTGSIEKFIFVTRDKELESKDLLSHMVEKFADFIQEYSWDSAFNYWIEMRLKWACINFRNNIRKIQSREFSLDEKLNDISPNVHEEELTIGDIKETTEGLWNSKRTEREDIEDKNFEQVVDDFAKRTFVGKDYEIYRMFFIEEMSILDIAAHLKQTYHSTISYTIADMKRKLREFLSTIDERYRELNKKYLAEEKKKNILGTDLPPDTDFSMSDLIPTINIDSVVSDIENQINTGIGETNE